MTKIRQFVLNDRWSVAACFFSFNSRDAMVTGWMFSEDILHVNIFIIVVIITLYVIE